MYVSYGFDLFCGLSNMYTSHTWMDFKIQRNKAAETQNIYQSKPPSKIPTEKNRNKKELSEGIGRLQVLGLSLSSFSSLCSCAIGAVFNLTFVSSPAPRILAASLDPPASDALSAMLPSSSVSGMASFVLRRPAEAGRFRPAVCFFADVAMRARIQSNRESIHAN